MEGYPYIGPDNGIASREAQMVQKLKNAGLEDYEVELVILRFIEDKSMIDVMNETGWLSINSANYYLRKAMRKLRLRGLK